MGIMHGVRRGKIKHLLNALLQYLGNTSQLLQWSPPSEDPEIGWYVWHQGQTLPLPVPVHLSLRPFQKVQKQGYQMLWLEMGLKPQSFSPRLPAPASQPVPGAH